MNDDDFDPDGPDDGAYVPVGSCDLCGVNLYPYDDPEYCEQCLWAMEQNRPSPQPREET